MGCKNSKIQPYDHAHETIVTQPPLPRQDSSNDQHEIQRVSDAAQNRACEASKVDDRFIDIEVMDAEAFNQVFIKQRQQAIDNHSYRSVTKSWQPKSLQQLADIIKAFSNGKCLIDCHWAIFYWIAINIEYDTVAYFSKNYKDQSAEGVFRRRKGVCAGYANIYKYLCNQLEISCEIVSGYSKGYGFDEREGAPSETDHAWNAVQIDQHWYLVDSTWGAGHLDDTQQFQRELTTYYFLTRPNEMIYHHLPEQSKWQLLRTPIDMSRFLQMPHFRADYFEFNLEMIQPRNENFIKLKANKSFALVIMKSPNNVQLTADLKLNNQKIDGGHRVIFNRKKQLYYCYFAPSTIGKHKITIYAKRGRTEAGTFTSVLDLTLNVIEILLNPIGYPKTWNCFFDLGLKVLSPSRTHIINLKPDERFTQILLGAPPTIELLGQLKDSNGEIVTRGTRVFYDRQQNFWRCKFAPNGTGIFNALILAKRKVDKGSYTSAVLFKINVPQIAHSPFSFPQTWQLFHDLNLRILHPLNRGIITLRDNQSFTEIRIKAPSNVSLISQFTNDKNEEISGGTQVYYDQEKDFWKCKFAPIRTGTFNAIILAKKKSDSGPYYTAVTFQIEVKSIYKTPITFPQTWQGFYDYDLKIESPRSCSFVLWPENASYAEVLIRAPNDIQLSSQIEYNNIKIRNGSLAQYNHEKQVWQLLFAPERTGRHELIVYAKRMNDRKTSASSVVKFHLNVTTLRHPIKFPMIYTQFETTKCRIYTPLNGILKKGSTIPLHCIIPDALSIYLTIDSKQIESKGYKDPIFQQDITVGSEEVTIYARYDQTSPYFTLIRYSVE